MRFLEFIRNKKINNLIILIVVSLSFSIFSLYPSLTDYYIVNDDILKWGFEDKLVSLGVSHSTIIFLTKIIPIPLSFAFAFILFVIGKKLKDENTGLLMSFLGLFYFWQTDIFFGANQRAFGLLIISLLLYYLFVKSNNILLIILIIGSYFYPPTLAIILLNLLFNNLSKKNFRKKTNALLILLLIIISILILKDFYISKIVSLEQAIEMPEFSKNGRVEVFNLNLIDTIKGKNIGFSLDPSFLFLLIINILLFLFLKKNFRINKKISLFILSGLVSYFLALIFFLRMYFPSRYIVYTLPLSLIIIFSLNFSRLMERKKFLNKRIILICLIITTMIFFVLFFKQTHLEKCSQKGLYSHLNSIPSDSKITGYPRTIDCAYKFTDLTKDNFFISYEFAPFFFYDYYQGYKDRSIEYLNAYYSNKRSHIKEFCNKYEIKFIIVEEELYSNDYFNYGWNWYEKRNKPVWYKMPFAELLRDANIYFKDWDEKTNKKRKFSLLYEPFDSYIRNITKDKKSFYLLNISDDKKIFKHNGTFIIDCSNI